jgi:hypothetical protein
MEQLWRTVPAGPDREMELRARADLPMRQRAFARAFLTAAQEAIDEFKRDD